MPMARLRDARTTGRPSVVALASVFGGVFAALIVLSIVADRDTSPSKSVHDAVAVDALVAYADAIYPGAELAGRAIVNGVRPDIAEFTAGRISVEVWTLDMQARQREFADARAYFDDAVAPETLGDAPEWFRRAFDHYDRAVELFLRAGAADGTARAALVDDAASIGDAGDRAFDRATARIQAARRALGLDADRRFSDKDIE